MSKLKWLDLVPSIMSAVASLAAAYAAFASLRVSREAKLLAKQSALATYHDEAAKTLSDATERLKKLPKFSRNWLIKKHAWSGQVKLGH